MFNIDSTITQKTRTGWEAKSTITLGEVKDPRGRDGKRRLQIHTYKRSRGGIHTTASVHVEADGCMTFAIFGDYSKTVAAVEAKCTEKSVKTLHNSVMTQQIDGIVAEARAFYQAKEDTAALHAKREAELAAQDQQQAA